MIAYLPMLLGGLMDMLSDPNREIRVAAQKALQVTPHAPESLFINSVSHGSAFMCPWQA